MPTLLEVLRQPHLRAAMFRFVCCPPLLAFAGLFGSNKETSTWRSTLCDSSTLCDHALVVIKTLFIIGLDAPSRYSLFERRADERQFDFTCPLSSEAGRLSVLQALRQTLKRRPCHALVCLDEIWGKSVYDLLASLRRQHGSRLRLTIETSATARARECELFGHAAVAVTDSACLVPELEQRALNLDWLRVLDAGRTALLLINDRAYVWANAS